MTHETARLFAGLAKRLGRGEPRTARIWFVGLEPRDEIPSLAALRRALRARRVESPAKCGVHTIISKVVEGLRSERFQTRWRAFRDNELFAPGSPVLLANLYPLGKVREVSWPAQYRRWFGLERDEYYRRIQTGEWGRLARLRQARLACGSPVTVCFGKQHWRHFAGCFTARHEQPVRVGRHLFYRESRVVMTEFFRHTRMPDLEVRRLVRLLNKEGLNPFAPRAECCVPQSPSSARGGRE